MREGLESTQVLSIWGNRPVTTSLTRRDILAGASYCIEPQSEDGILLALTPVGAEYLAGRLHLLVSETRRQPARQQAGSTE